MSSETGSDQPASDVASAIPATLVLAPDYAGEQSMLASGSLPFAPQTRSGRLQKGRRAR
jgi:hypothetical protein